MFGLFSSKSEKYSKKTYKIHRQFLASCRRVVNNPQSNFWIKYCVDTQDYLNELLGQALANFGYRKEKFTLSIS